MGRWQVGGGGELLKIQPKLLQFVEVVVERRQRLALHNNLLFAFIFITTGSILAKFKIGVRT
jgi:hypothetical protein